MPKLKNKSHASQTYKQTEKSYAGFVIVVDTMLTQKNQF